MNSISLFIVSSFMFVLVCCTSGEKQNSPFTIRETDQGIELRENGKPVFNYQKKPKSLTGQYICTNYIHPLYSLGGDTLTEEFPPDHPYHRGVFWAWHQLYIDGKRLGDGWTNDSISQEVVNLKYEKGENNAQLRINVLWNSSVTGKGKPFMNENTTITVHKLDSGIRKIDFEIKLSASETGLQIGGSADAKGYGGYCVRMKLPDSLVFMSDNGPVIPQELQIKAGLWMDFSGRFGRSMEVSGVTILCQPGTGSWILRRKGSMQNAVFPGSQRIDVPVDRPVILHYRLIIHNGNSGSLNLPLLQQEYADVKSAG